ncbi:hypothetical protein [Chitinimonas arctica]|nr:hypothetical protein [Chitinimonas arctica]
MKSRWLRWLLIGLALASVFAAYFTPMSKVVLANFWAMCGF